jgi:hypothetical protein
MMTATASQPQASLVQAQSWLCVFFGDHVGAGESKSALEYDRFENTEAVCNAECRQGERPNSQSAGKAPVFRHVQSRDPDPPGTFGHSAHIAEPPGICWDVLDQVTHNRLAGQCEHRRNAE